MSYALELAADANRALYSLPIDAQEAVFDVLDRVADEADQPSFDDARDQLVVVRGEDGVVYVQIHYAVDHGRRAITLERLYAVIDDTAL